ncbi:hypothetical protein [Tessaracoccus sp. O5.2]|uniref:hypothetical protein n=1 Tax=Tessaracoccus sp. O5.2 TaxID=3157622 RepID=UPI0036DD5898
MAGTSCGSCLRLVRTLMVAELEKAGTVVSNALCEHFELSRAQLFDVVRVTGLTTFSAPASTSCPTSGTASSTPGSGPATPTARHCGP